MPSLMELYLSGDWSLESREAIERCEYDLGCIGNAFFTISEGGEVRRLDPSKIYLKTDEGVA